MLLTAAAGSLAALALGAVVLGLAYGAIAPASTHLLVPKTPRPVFNLVMSLRQIGVPLGGVLGALFVPPMVGLIGWRGALLTELVPVLAMLLLLELPRRGWDSDRDRDWKLWGPTLLQPFRLLREDRRLRALSVASFVYSGVQLCFIAFMTVQLTSVVRLDLVRAGFALALVPDRRVGEPAGLGLGRRSLPVAVADAGGPGLRHGRGGAGDRAVRPGLALGRGAGGRGVRGHDRERVHRGGLCGIRAHRRGTADRGHGPGHRDDVLRRDAAALAFGAAVTAWGGWFLPYAGLAVLAVGSAGCCCCSGSRMPGGFGATGLGVGSLGARVGGCRSPGLSCGTRWVAGILSPLAVAVGGAVGGEGFLLLLRTLLVSSRTEEGFNADARKWTQIHANGPSGTPRRRHRPEAAAYAARGIAEAVHGICVNLRPFACICVRPSLLPCGATGRRPLHSALRRRTQHPPAGNRLCNRREDFPG